MKSRKGLTLIELIISIAIISVLSITILSMFNISIASIFKSGKRTERVFEVKEKIDIEITNNENKTVGTDEVLITIPGVVTNKKIKGTYIEERSKDKFNIKITTFVPNK